MEALISCPAWLRGPSQDLLRLANAGTLHHAMLLQGKKGIGKQDFAHWLAQALLCSQREEHGACGQCSPCRQIMHNAHSDLYIVSPEGASESIRVDAVRDLVDWLQLTAGVNSFRVAIMLHADTLNHHAANALLKTLEEPADNVVLILTASRPAQLPATIRSRCQKLHLRLDDQQAALQWLRAQGVADAEQSLMEAGGAPLQALSRSQPEPMAQEALLLSAWSDLFHHRASVVRIAGSLAELPTQDCLAFLAKACVIAVKESASVSSGTDTPVRRCVSETVDMLTTEQWFAVHAQILLLHSRDSASFKTNTVLEGLFADIRSMVNG